MIDVFVSVVIPAYNSENTIGGCLKSLQEQDYPRENYEIIVVDDGSSDKTKDVISSFHDVKLITQKNAGPASARNLGASHAKGEVLLFTDADCIPDKNWIKEMTASFSNPEVVGAAGTYRTLNDKSTIARYVGHEIAQRHERMKLLENIDFVGTYSAAYRKDVYNAFGGFDTTFRRASGEDPDLSYRMAAAGRKLLPRIN